MPGEIRWFASVKGDDMAVPNGLPFVLVEGDEEGELVRSTFFDPKDYKATDIIKPQSRTFIPSRVTDNPHLIGTGYMAQLQSMPEPLRSQMLNGDFNAGVEDGAYQVIPTAWIDAAQARWVRRDAKGVMDSMGVDVARGGKDGTIISRRHGPWYDELICFPGSATPDGPTVMAHVLQARRDLSPVHIDLVGWGASPYDFLVTNGIQTVGINGANRTDEAAIAGQLRFFNVRAMLYWRMREALDPSNPVPIYLPPDKRLRADLAAPTWKLSSGAILVESKEDIFTRLKRSTDYGDAVVMARLETLKISVRDAMKGQAQHDPYAGM